jgi:D-methionine transport system substrate-binding protein
VRIKRPLITAAAAFAVFALTACGGDSTSGEATESAATEAAVEDEGDGDPVTITVGASPTPHAEILQFIQDNLAAEVGLDIKIVEFDDYVLPNVALDEGDVDANYFQHIPYFEQQVQDKGFEFSHYPGVHIEPYGVYSNTLTDLADLAEGSKVGVTDDPSNQSRALVLLSELGLFALPDEPLQGDSYTTFDIADNPLHLEFVSMPAEQLPAALPDLAIAVINGNVALNFGLKPSEDAIALESGVDNPYSNIVAVRTEDFERPELVALDELLRSPEVKEFILERWPDGEVIPAF